MTVWDLEVSHTTIINDQDDDLVLRFPDGSLVRLARAGGTWRIKQQGTHDLNRQSNN